MSMQAATLEILERADLPPRQARAIAQAIELEMAASHGALATRHDLRDLRNELKVDTADLKGEFKADMADLRRELKVDIADLRNELKVDMAEHKSELVRWVFVCILGQTAMLLGAGYFFLAQYTA